LFSLAKLEKVKGNLEQAIIYCHKAEGHFTHLGMIRNFRQVADFKACLKGDILACEESL
jgi:hypothetical protein